MKSRKNRDLGNVSMLELFRIEVEAQTGVLSAGLLELERGKSRGKAGALEALMRAAHSLKGAARIVNLRAAVRLAHAMEDCIVAAQKDQLTLGRAEADLLLRGSDLLAQLAKRSDAEVAEWENDRGREIDQLLAALEAVMRPKPAPPDPPLPDPAPPTAALAGPLAPAETPATSAHLGAEVSERVLRLNAANLNRLLGLAGESLVESRWLRPFTESLQRFKRNCHEMRRRVDSLQATLDEEDLSDRARAHLDDLNNQVNEAGKFLAERLQELDLYDRRAAQLSSRLYLEVLRTRMRPFGEGVRRFPRMVRDLSHSLGKSVKLEVFGESTQVDRDILERLETPLAHLIRNAVDHGCEIPATRQHQGKAPESTVRLEARHSAGVLLVTVTDDGSGVDVERIRAAIVRQKIASGPAAEKMGEAELLEYLFLPGFSLKDQVTEISGRGVGLDVVQNMVKSVRGSIRIHNQPGRGFRVQLHLPLTLSVLRALLVEISGEPYALPLSRIARAVQLPRTRIQTLEGRHHFQFGDQQVGLITAHQVFEVPEPKTHHPDLQVVVLGERNARYGIVVDRFLGERELVVQPLDERLGKLDEINAAALMEDGAPVLIIDIDGLTRSIDRIVSQGPLDKVRRSILDAETRRQKRVLAVDDSLTVRELERKVLSGRGYLTDVAVDGMEAWNAVRTGDYDLVITDVDMPRMDGIELTGLIKADPQLQSLPVLIVSYKDRDEDRLRGLEAGADYYLTKGSFHDETLVKAVVDLIGEPEE